MSESSKSITIGGTGFFNLLFLVFLVLKLTKVIDWSWWWITAPLWVPVSISVLFFVLVLLTVTVGLKKGKHGSCW